MQKKTEIKALLEFMAPRAPKLVLEIGTCGGGTLYLFSTVFKPELIISVDLPGGPFGGGYAEERITLYESFGNVKLIRDDSHKQSTLDKVKELLNGKQLDMLFIDGDHTYDGIKKDFETYESFVKKEGVIVFHDINDQADPRCNVKNFWNELRGNNDSMEIIINPEQLGAGIGLIFKH
jgi:predicted O-methyltransferase YrrM